MYDSLRTCYQSYYMCIYLVGTRWSTVGKFTLLAAVEKKTTPTVHGIHRYCIYNNKYVINTLNICIYLNMSIIINNIQTEKQNGVRTRLQSTKQTGWWCVRERYQGKSSVVMTRERRKLRSLVGVAISVTPLNKRDASGAFSRSPVVRYLERTRGFQDAVCRCCPVTLYCREDASLPLRVRGSVSVSLRLLSPLCSCCSSSLRFYRDLC